MSPATRASSARAMTYIPSTALHWEVESSSEPETEAGDAQEVLATPKKFPIMLAEEDFGIMEAASGGDDLPGAKARRMMGVSMVSGFDSSDEDDDHGSTSSSRPSSATLLRKPFTSRRSRASGKANNADEALNSDSDSLMSADGSVRKRKISLSNMFGMNRNSTLISAPPTPTTAAPVSVPTTKTATSGIVSSVSTSRTPVAKLTTSAVKKPTDYREEEEWIAKLEQAEKIAKLHTAIEHRPKHHDYIIKSEPVKTGAPTSKKSHKTDAVSSMAPLQPRQAPPRGPRQWRESSIEQSPSSIRASSLDRSKPIPLRITKAATQRPSSSGDAPKRPPRSMQRERRDSVHLKKEKALREVEKLSISHGEEEEDARRPLLPSSSSYSYGCKGNIASSYKKAMPPLEVDYLSLSQHSSGSGSDRSPALSDGTAGSLSPSISVSSYSTNDTSLNEASYEWDIVRRGVKAPLELQNMADDIGRSVSPFSKPRKAPTPPASPREGRRVQFSLDIVSSDRVEKEIELCQDDRAYEVKSRKPKSLRTSRPNVGRKDSLIDPYLSNESVPSPRSPAGRFHSRDERPNSVPFSPASAKTTAFSEMMKSDDMRMNDSGVDGSVTYIVPPPERFGVAMSNDTVQSPYSRQAFTIPISFAHHSQYAPMGNEQYPFDATDIATSPDLSESGWVRQAVVARTNDIPPFQVHSGYSSRMYAR